jgi:inner membrane protein
LIVGAFLSVIPDLDTLGSSPYNSVWSHRGFSHSLAFALVVGFATAGMTGWYFQLGFWRLAALFSIIVASHPLLDVLTTAGNGIALWWPVSDTRVHPLGPIPVSDIGFDWPDPTRSRAVRAELLEVWLPLGILVMAVMMWRCGWWRRNKSVAEG